MKPYPTWFVQASFAVALVACSGKGSDSSPTPAGTTTDDRDTSDTSADACPAHVLQADFELDDDLGALGDPANWTTDVPPGAVVSATFLRLQDSEGASDVFRELITATTADLVVSDGLLGVSLGKSPSCGVSRTLALWESEAAMMDFVLGEAHLDAIQRVGEVSRGGSITDHWSASDLETIAWESVVPLLAAHDGPVY